MPLRSTTAFDPETLEKLQGVLKEACQWLTGKDGKEPDESTRTSIALRIIECAKGGETDPAKIRSFALGDLDAILTEDVSTKA